MPKRKDLQFSCRTSQKRSKEVVDAIGLTVDMFGSRSSSDDQDEVPEKFSEASNDGIY